MSERRFGAHSIVMGSIRVLLVFALFLGLYQERRLVFMISVIGLIITFLPRFLKKYFDIETGPITEILVIFFLYGALFLGEVRGLFSSFAYWDVFLNFVAALILGLIGLSLMYALYRGKIVNANPVVMAFFAFCFAVAIGSVWEIFEFALDRGFGFILQKGLEDTIKDMAVNSIGALIVSIFGYYSLKKGDSRMFSNFLIGIVRKNLKFLGSKDLLERSSEEIENLIKKGESEKLEFKSSLRINIHTGDIDKKMEHAVLKTVVAFLNSNGGTLLVGVSDYGHVIGLEGDKFKDNDSLKLHVTNLIKKRIGSEFLPYIDFELFSVNDKHVLRIDCRISPKRVFLKGDNEEEFYVRNGPASVKLTGNSMIDYIHHRFGR